MTETGLHGVDGSDGGAVEARHLPVPAAPPESGATAARAVPEVLEPAGPRTLADLGATRVPAPILAAAGGFLAGLATWALSRALRPRRRRLGLRRASRRGRALEIAGTRSFLVDVHVIRR